MLVIGNLKTLCLGVVCFRTSSVPSPVQLEHVVNRKGRIWEEHRRLHIEDVHNGRLRRRDNIHGRPKIQQVGACSHGHLGKFALRNERRLRNQESATENFGENFVEKENKTKGWREEAGFSLDLHVKQARP